MYVHVFTITYTQFFIDYCKKTYTFATRVAVKQYVITEACKQDKMLLLLCDTCRLGPSVVRVFMKKKENNFPF